MSSSIDEPHRCHQRHYPPIQPKPSIDQSYIPILPSTTSISPPASTITNHSPSRPPIFQDNNVSSPQNDDGHIMRYDETWQVSICRKCQIGVHGNTLIRHLREKCHRYHKDDWGPIVEALKDRPQPRSKDSFPRPCNGIPPIADIKIWDGFACNLCEYIVTSKEVIHSRHKKVHRSVLRYQEIFYRPVKVQVTPSNYIPDWITVMVSRNYRLFLDRISTWTKYFSSSTCSSSSDWADTISLPTMSARMTMKSWGSVSELDRWLVDNLHHERSWQWNPWCDDNEILCVLP